MQLPKRLSFATSLALAIPLSSQIAVPKINNIELTLERTSTYQYRVQSVDKHRYLELRAVGKTAWVRVEEIRCERIGEIYESPSLDYEYRCDFTSPESKKEGR